MFYSRKKGESKYNFGSPKEDLSQYMKNYHKQKYICECGCVMSIGAKSLHLKSNKHKNLSSTVQNNKEIYEEIQNIKIKLNEALNGKPKEMKKIEKIEKIKGKRGRPRKIKDENEIIKPKGKRGRPSKKQQNEENKNNDNIKECNETNNLNSLCEKCIRSYENCYC